MVYDKVIEGIGVNLRAVEESDAEFIMELRRSREKTRFVHAITGTVEDQRQWIRNQRARENDYYFIAERKNGEPFGAAGYYGLEGPNGELGRMVMDGEYVENCEAIFLLRQFAFDIMKAEYARCTVHPENKPVIAQQKRFGCVQVGTIYDEEGQFELLDCRVYREAYEARKDKLAALIRKGYEKNA